MYQGFDLKIDDISFFDSDEEYTKTLDENKENIKLVVDEILMSSDVIDAEKIISQWFPKDHYHVFISHSHKDEYIAKALANWLYENFKLKSFLDSHIWGYANDLLYDLNDLYARKNDTTFEYTPAIYNASNVHLMLSTALSEVIDSTECLFFINTENTIRNINLNNGRYEPRTDSAWIMHELKSSSIIRKKQSEHRSAKLMESKSAGLESIHKSVGYSYSISTNHLVKISQEKLSQWAEICVSYKEIERGLLQNRNFYSEYDALDKLYLCAYDLSPCEESDFSTNLFN
ncbi:hypothetical protein [Aeromonas enterica]